MLAASSQHQPHLHHPHSLRPQAAMEVLFLESSVQLLEEFSDEFFQHREFITFYDNMLQWVAGLLAAC